MAHNNSGNIDTMEDFPNWRDYVSEFSHLDEATQKSLARALKRYRDEAESVNEENKKLKAENEGIKADSIGARGNLPKLKKTQSGSVSSASTGPLSSHDSATASGEDVELEDESDIVPHGHATKTWSERNEDDDSLYWANEAAIARYVHNALMDLLITLGIAGVISIQSEMQFRGQRPDKYLLYMVVEAAGGIK